MSNDLQAIKTGWGGVGVGGGGVSELGSIKILDSLA